MSARRIGTTIAITTIDETARRPAPVSHRAHSSGFDKLRAVFGKPQAAPSPAPVAPQLRVDSPR
jgi:hypothetical protein